MHRCIIGETNVQIFCIIVLSVIGVGLRSGVICGMQKHQGSKLKYMVAAGSLAVSAIATPAIAADWWLVYGAGEKPVRQMTYLNLGSYYEQMDPSRMMTVDVKRKLPKEDLIDYRRIDGAQIFEAEKSPGMILMRYLVKCREQLVAQTTIEIRWRDSRLERPADIDWTPASATPQYQQVAKFVCDASSRSDTGDMLRVTDDYDPLPITWQIFWKDATEPEWTSTKSVEELNAEYETALAETKKLLESGLAMAGEKLQEIKTDRETTIADQKARFSRMRGRAWPLLESWLGRSEVDLVRSWGQPHGSYNSDGSRFVYYVYGIERGVVDRYGNERVQETFRCDMAFEMREMKIADYRSSGNYCGTAAENLPSGTPPE